MRKAYRVVVLLADEPIEHAAQTHHEIDVSGCADEEHGYIEEVRLLSRHHSSRGAGIAEPLEYGRIDVLEEVSEVGNVGYRSHESDASEHAIPPNSGTTHPATRQREGCREQREGERHDGYVARNDVVKPHAAHESRERIGGRAFHHAVQRHVFRQSEQRQKGERESMKAQYPRCREKKTVVLLHKYKGTIKVLN